MPLSPVTLDGITFDPADLQSNGGYGFQAPVRVRGVDYMWQHAFLVAGLAEMQNRIEAGGGGVVAGVHRFDASTMMTDPGPGRLRLNAPSQNQATRLVMSAASASGVDLAGLLSQFGGSTSVVKGFLRLGSPRDASRWLLLRIDNVAPASGWLSVDVVTIAASAANPFAVGDEVGWSFSRVGDAGSGAPAATEQTLGLVRLATLAEVEAGGVPAAAVTPKALTDAMPTLVPEIRRPVNVSPVDGAVGVREFGPLAASAFLAMYGTTHAASQWQIASVTSFASLIHDSGAVAASTSYTIPNWVLSVSTLYYWRVRYRDSLGVWSPWSAGTSFTTKAAFEYGAYLLTAGASPVAFGAWGRDVDTLTRLSVSSVPSFTGAGVAISADGTYVLVAGGAAPWLAFYRRSLDTFQRLADLSSGEALTGAAIAVAIAADGSYGAVTTSSLLVVLKRTSATAWVRSGTPDVQPGSQANGVAMSANGVYIAVAMASSPFVAFYKRTGDTITRLAAPASLPAGQGRSVAMSPDGVYCAVGCASSPFVAFYKRTGDSWSRLADPAVAPAGAVLSVACSADGAYWSMALSSSPFCSVYFRAADVFTQLAAPATVPSVAASAAAISADGVYVAIGWGSAPYFYLYKRSGAGSSATLSRLVTPTGGDAPTAGVTSLAMYP